MSTKGPPPEVRIRFPGWRGYLWLVLLAVGNAVAFHLIFDGGFTGPNSYLRFVLERSPELFISFGALTVLIPDVETNHDLISRTAPEFERGVRGIGIRLIWSLGDFIEVLHDRVNLDEDWSPFDALATAALLLFLVAVTFGTYFVLSPALYLAVAVAGAPGRVWLAHPAAASEADANVPSLTRRPVALTLVLSGVMLWFLGLLLSFGLGW